MTPLNDHTNYTIVQIQATRFVKNSHANARALRGLVPHTKTWEELTDMAGGSNQSENNRRFFEDTTGLLFSSIGDWTGGHLSFFDYEWDKNGLDEFVKPYMEAIKNDIDAEFLRLSNPASISITTLWKSESQQDGQGNWASDISYVGVFQLEDIATLMPE